LDITTRAARTSTASTEAKVASPAHDRRERVGAGPAVAGVGDRKRGRRLKLSGQQRAAILGELAAARARVAEPEAEAAAVRAWPEQVRGQPAFDDAVSGTTRSGRCEQVRFCRQLR